MLETSLGTRVTCFQSWAHGSCLLWTRLSSISGLILCLPSHLLPIHPSIWSLSHFLKEVFPTSQPPPSSPYHELSKSHLYFLPGLITTFNSKYCWCGACLAVQFLRTHLPVQGTWVQSLVWDDSTCLGTTKPQNYWAHAPEPLVATTEPTHPRACAPQREKPQQACTFRWRVDPTCHK